MAILEIKKFPSEVLKLTAEPVEAVDDSIRKLMDDMAETMYASTGIGLAAPQVGVSKRVIVVDVPGADEDEEGSGLFALANPEIVFGEGVEEIEEGCLSVPGFLIKIKRKAFIKLKGLNRDGQEVMIETDGLLAIAFQHEIDHLDGKLIIDRASMLKREFYLKKVKKALMKSL